MREKTRLFTSALTNTNSNENTNTNSNENGNANTNTNTHANTNTNTTEFWLILFRRSGWLLVPHNDG